MFNDLDDIHEGSDEQVKKELVDMGIDINKAQKGFQATLCNSRGKLGAARNKERR